MSRETLLEFPCDFPLKIMGAADAGFAASIAAVVVRHAPDFDVATMQLRSSKSGTYLSLTCTVRAGSQQQLDALSHELTPNPTVRVLL